MEEFRPLVRLLKKGRLQLRMAQDNSELAQHFFAKSIAGGLVLSVLATLMSEANDMTAYLTSSEASTEGILSLLNEVLANIQTSATKFQGLIANFDGLCESLKEE